MEWTSPTYAEIKMDAEIGSYQEDGEPTRESPIADTADAHAPKPNGGQPTAR